MMDNTGATRTAVEVGTKWLDAEEQRTWRALVVANTLLMHHLDEQLRREYGVSLTEYEILVRLSEREHHEMRMAQIADSLCLSRSRITHTVARMEQGGLVRRQPATEDGRGVVASMTEAGQDLLDRAAPSHVTSVREHLVDLADPADLAAVGRVMDAVADDLLPEHPEAEIR